jgi:hypothetical protein
MTIDDGDDNSTGTMSTTNSSESGKLKYQCRQSGKKAQTIELEQCLTATIEKMEPWLPNCNAGSNPSSLLAFVLSRYGTSGRYASVAQELGCTDVSSAGMNPEAPVMGFTTPNPMPHQYIGGLSQGCSWNERDKGSETRSDSVSSNRRNKE